MPTNTVRIFAFSTVGIVNNRSVVKSYARKYKRKPAPESIRIVKTKAPSDVRHVVSRPDDISLVSFSSRTLRTSVAVERAKTWTARFENYRFAREVKCFYSPVHRPKLRLRREPVDRTYGMPSVDVVQCALRAPNDFTLQSTRWKLRNDFHRNAFETKTMSKNVSQFSTYAPTDHRIAIAPDGRNRRAYKETYTHTSHDRRPSTADARALKLGTIGKHAVTVTILYGNAKQYGFTLTR